MRDYNLLHHIGIETNGEKIWYIAEMIGCVIEVDIATGKSACICDIPGFTDEGSYRNLKYFNGKLYILPFKTDEMFIYDIDNSTMDKVILPDKNLHYVGALIDEGKMYLYGDSSFITVYGLAKNTTEMLELDPIKLGIGFTPSEWFWTSSLLCEHDKFFAMNGDNGMVKLDADDNISYIQMGESHHKWKSQNSVMVNMDFKVLYINENNEVTSSTYEKDGRLKHQACIDFDTKWEVYPYVYAALSDMGWISFPFLTNGLELIDENEGVTKRYYDLDISEADINKDNGYLFGCGNKYSNDVIYAIDQMFGHLVIVDVSSNSIEKKELVFDEDGIKSIKDAFKHRLSEDNGIIQEKKTFADLNWFINDVLKEG